MNVIELAAVATPFGGAVSAGAAALRSGFWKCAVFSLGGLILGTAIYFAAVGACGYAMKLSQQDSRKENMFVGLVSLLSVLLVLASPIIAIFLSDILAHRLL